MARVAAILRGSGFFSLEEQEIGVSLVRERLEHGEASLYFFEFAERDGQLLGYTCFGPIGGTKSGYDLYWIAVDNRFRGQGIGTALIRHTEREIASRRGTHVYVETSSSTLYGPTRAFYERNGYVSKAMLPDYYRPGDGLLIYVKVL
jgi:ribosomal protein S18 acetylase RimI-like enzyme